MKRIYKVQMEECEVTDDSTSAIATWDAFYDGTHDLEEARAQAVKLADDVKKHKVLEVLETSNPDNIISVCISEYDEETNNILGVIEIEDIQPGQWNIKCGNCRAYCSEGTCPI